MKETMNVVHNEKTNTIMISGVIDSEGCAYLCMILLDIEQKMNSTNTVKPINLYINSPGGDYMAGIGLCDVIEHLSVPVYTYGCGEIASAAFKIFISGHLRFTYRNTRFLLHSLSGGYHGYTSDMQRHLDNMHEMTDDIREFVKRRTNIPENIIVEALNGKDLWMSAEEAIKYKVADVLLQ